MPGVARSIASVKKYSQSDLQSTNETLLYKGRQLGKSKPGRLPKADARRTFVLSGLDAQDMRKTQCSWRHPVNADNPPLISLLRIPQVLSMTGLTRAALYKRTAAGYFVSPVKACGPKRAAWPSDEVQEIIRAHIAGKSEADIAALVRALHQRRGGPSQSPAHEQRAA